jgi:hypothetical protein
MGETSTKKKKILKKVRSVSASEPFRSSTHSEDFRRRIASNRFVKPVRLRTVRSYEDAQKYVKKQKLKNSFEWKKYRSSGKMPKDIPSNPEFVYRNSNYLLKPKNRHGWVDMETWLGVKPKKYCSFIEAKKYARSLNLGDRREWESNHIDGNIPPDIPLAPNEVYTEFEGWFDFLGISKNRRPLVRARFEYRILFNRQLEFFEDLNKVHQFTKEELLKNVFTETLDDNELIYSEMKSSLLDKPDISNSFFKSEKNSYLKINELNLKNKKFPKISDELKKLKKNSIHTIGDIINYDSELPAELNPWIFSYLKIQAISLIFGKTTAKSFLIFYKEYSKIAHNYLKQLVHHGKLVEQLVPLHKSIKNSNYQDDIKLHQKVAEKTLKIIDKAKIKKYEIGKTKRTKLEIKFLHLKWIALRMLNQYDKMLSLENEFVNNPDLHYSKSEIYGPLSEVCLRLGKISKSLFYNQKAIDSEPDSSTNWYNKACIHALSGKVDFACNSLLIAVGLGGDKVISDAKTDTDFSKIKNNEQFKKIIKSNKKKLFNI